MNRSEPIGHLVAEKPARSWVFERLGIDYCCGGRQPLDKACAEHGLDPADVMLALDSCDKSPSTDHDWFHDSLTQLADHIESTHHAYLKHELPRLSAFIAKVAVAHGKAHPELAQLCDTFENFRQELEMHMHKEEAILFPICRQMEASSTSPAFHCGSIRNPIRVMESEHDHAGSALQAFRQLTNGYKPPEGVCHSYHEMLSGLQLLEADMHQHVHEENNILFPRAIELEEKRASN